MPQEFYYPVSIATHDLPAGFDDGNNVGGANKNDSCRPGGGRSGPATHDDASSYVELFANGFPNTEQALNVDWPGPMAAYTGSLFTLGMRDRYRFSTAAISVTRSVGFVNAAGTMGTARETHTSSHGSTQPFDTHGPDDVTTAATYRPGGGSWSAADFANDQTTFIFLHDDDTGGGGNVSYGNFTSVWGEIDYTPVAGGFVFLLGLVGLMSLQLAGPMTDYTQFEKFLQWRHDFHPRHTTMQVAEKLQAWDEYKSYRHPTFYF